MYWRTPELAYVLSKLYDKFPVASFLSSFEVSVFKRSGKIPSFYQPVSLLIIFRNVLETLIIWLSHSHHWGDLMICLLQREFSRLKRLLCMRALETTLETCALQTVKNRTA